MAGRGTSDDANWYLSRYFHHLYHQTMMCSHQSDRVMTVDSIFRRVTIIRATIRTSLTIINVVQVGMRVLRVIHYQRTSQPIAVLRRHM
jgi:hypothetical protein